MKAVYFEFNWYLAPSEEILVTYVNQDESESDAILRAIEMCGKDIRYYVKKVEE